MANITSPVNGFNGRVVGVTFTDGDGETELPGAIAYFKRHSYTVEGEASATAPISEGDPSDKWTKAELKAYATEHDIDLGDATKNADILELLTAATEDDDTSDTTSE